MQKINKHCLVITTEEDSVNFPSCELVSFKDIQQLLCGNHDIFSWNQTVNDEIIRQTDLRLKLGRRVVIAVPKVNHYQWDKFESMADRYDIDIFYNSALAPQFEISGTILESSRQLTGYSVPDNVLVLGDIHGNASAFQQAIDFARSRDLFIISLGDLIDYGSNNVKCIKLMYDLWKNGQALYILGNHEKKLSRWIDAAYGKNFQGKLSSSNLVTVNEIVGLRDTSFTRFTAAWNALYSSSYQHVVCGNWLLVHGACTPNMWNISSHRLHGQDSNMAYYGQVDEQNPRIDGYPKRIWEWTKDVPVGKNVVVGHDWLDRLNNNITEMTNSSGGRVFAIDCGSSKGGRLAGMQIDLKSDQYSVHYF